MAQRDACVLDLNGAFFPEQAEDRHGTLPIHRRCLTGYDYKNIQSDDLLNVPIYERLSYKRLQYVMQSHKYRQPDPPDESIFQREKIDVNKAAVLLNSKKNAGDIERPMCAIINFENESQRKRYIDNVRKLAKLRNILISRPRQQLLLISAVTQMALITH